jgi:branched-chain amino acid transport system ATP-binding protein
MSGAVLLEARQLTSGYGRVRIVQQVSLAVREGEVLAIIGRNGVGKTTLIKTLMGALPSFGGSVLFENEDITAASPHLRARKGLGYVPQGRGIFATLTVNENLLMGERIGDAPISKRSYDRIYGFFPVLRERGQQMAGSFSGGQQQQLALGRALLGRPRVLLLDEPSEGIQPNIVEEMGRLLTRLSAEERLAVVLVEQNLDLIRAMAHRCIVIDKGAVIEEISPARLADPEVAKRFLAI